MKNESSIQTLPSTITGEPSAKKLPETMIKDLSAQAFPTTGKARPAEIIKFLSIGRSTFYRLVQSGKIKKPQKIGARISVWDWEYIRGLDLSSTEAGE